MASNGLNAQAPSHPPESCKNKRQCYLSNARPPQRRASITCCQSDGKRRQIVRGLITFANEALRGHHLELCSPHLLLLVSGSVIDLQKANKATSGSSQHQECTPQLSFLIFFCTPFFRQGAVTRTAHEGLVTPGGHSASSAWCSAPPCRP